MNKNLISLFFGLVGSYVSSQEYFYINNDGMVGSVYVDISDKWKDLNFNEAEIFLINSGYSDIEKGTTGEISFVKGQYKKGKGWGMSRELGFKDNEIYYYQDAMTMLTLCNECASMSATKSLGNDYWGLRLKNAYLEDARTKDNAYTEKLLKLYLESRISFGFDTEPDIIKKGMTEIEIQDIDHPSVRNNENIQILRSLTSKNYDNAIRAVNVSTVYLKNQYEEVMVGDVNLKEISPYTLREFIDVFIYDSKLHGITFPPQKINAKFEDLEGNLVGVSFAMNINDTVLIKADPENWQNASLPKKWYIMYHELGHDLLNLDHGEGGRMMFNYSDRGYSWEEFLKDKEEMFKLYKKYK